MPLSTTELSISSPWRAYPRKTNKSKVAAARIKSFTCITYQKGIEFTTPQPAAAPISRGKTLASQTHPSYFARQLVSATDIKSSGTVLIYNIAIPCSDSKQRASTKTWILTMSKVTSFKFQRFSLPCFSASFQVWTLLQFIQLQLTWLS